MTAEPSPVEGLNRALTCLAALFLVVPAWAQGQPSSTAPFRGNLRVRTALSWSYNRQLEQKIFPTLESGLFNVQEARLDWLGVADEGYRFTHDSWLAYRGALAGFTEARPQLTALPGFEWVAPPRNLTIYGSDHFCPGRASEPQWPALRIGRLMADMAADEWGLRILKPDWLRRRRTITVANHLYEEALAVDLVTGNTYNGPTLYDLSNLKGLEKPYFLGTEPLSSDPYQNVSAQGLLYPPIESIWGPTSTDLASSLNLDRGHALGQMLQTPPGLQRMAQVADLVPGDATSLLNQLQDGDDGLRKGEPRAVNGFMERLPLPPGWPLDKQPEALRDNIQYSQAYGEYYALLEKGLNLFQNYGASLSKDGLQTARHGWFQGTPDQHLVDLRPSTIRTWDQMVDWLERYDPQQTIVAMLSTPDSAGPAGWLQALDPRKLRDRPKARERFALVEMAYDLQKPTDFAGVQAPGQGPYPGGSPLASAPPAAGVTRLRHYYNLALRNGWRVAPATAVENLGSLDAHHNRPLPAVRSTYTGLYPGPEHALINGGHVQMGSGGDRIRQFLQGLNQRRTYVSENAYVDALLYARDVSTGRTVVMGGQLFEGGGAPTTFEFTLRLNVPVRNSTTENRRIKVEDIKVVEVVERERELGPSDRRLRIVEATRNPAGMSIGEDQLSQLISDESPACKYYTSGAVAQPGGSSGIATVLANYGLTGARLNPPEADTYPLPLTLTWRTIVRPHQPGGTVAYYVKAELPSMGNLTAGSIVTAPLWTVSDWTRFTSIDEAQ